jgi:1-acyl-sn-glycerol-3-phosphate acyltransferase
LGGARLAELAWRWFCRAVLSTHFRRHEVDGLGRLPRRGPVLLCANHPSALADAAIIQAVCRRPVHPLARSGLFRNPLARPILAIIQADSFEACYRKFAAGGVLLIFPEGESHSHPGLRQVKTGAARLALGALQRNGEAPLVLPIGLNFSAVGRFRSSLLVVIGEPVPVERPAGESEEESVLRITGKLDAALRDVTLNPESWEDLDLLRRIERFFALRHGKYRRRNLKQRFRALQKLSAAQHRLHAMAPHRVTEIADLLREFEQLCERFGVYDYHLTVEYTPALVARFLLRVVLVLLVAVPLGAWGLLNSIVPYSLTGYLAVRTASDRYQYDTAKILFGMLFFGLCWGGQTAFVYFTWGLPAAGAYALALLPTAAAALYLRRERERILDNIRVFFLFLRKKELRELLEAKREELERALARLAKMAAGRRIAG